MLKFHILSLSLVFILSIISRWDLQAQSRIKYHSNDRTGIFSQRKENGEELITLYPGFQYRANNLTITAPNGSQVRSQQFDLSNTKFFLDVKTKDITFFYIFGTYLLYQNYTYDQTVQGIDMNLGGFLPNQSASLGSPYQNRNLGTKVDGRIESLMAVIFLGEAGKDNFRFGFGVGPSNVKMQGNPDFYDGLATQIPVANLSTNGQLADSINHIGNISLLRNGKLESDPVNVYLLSQLGTPGNLELLGLYQFSKGNLDLKGLNPYTLIWINEFGRGALSPLEVIALANLGKSDLNFYHRNVSTFYYFFEVPLWDVTFRFGYGGPLYYEDGYRFTFRNLDFSTYIPIDF